MAAATIGTSAAPTRDEGVSSAIVKRLNMDPSGP